MSNEFPQVITHKGMTIKLYDWMDYPKGEAARNVVAYDESGDEIWVIEPLGGNPGTDCYTHIESKDGKLYAYNFQCYDCVIDDTNGKVLQSYFTK